MNTHPDRTQIFKRTDILCEGHCGIFQPAERVEACIRRYLRQHGCEASKIC